MTATLESRRSAMPPRVFNRLIQALTTLTGIEALVTLRDVCNLSLDEAGDVQEWGARALLSAALREMPGVGDRATGGCRGRNV